MTRDRGRLTPRPSGEAGPPGGGRRRPRAARPQQLLWEMEVAQEPPGRSGHRARKLANSGFSCCSRLHGCLEKGKASLPMRKWDWTDSRLFAVHSRNTLHTTHTHTRTHSCSLGHASRLPLRCGRSHRSPSVPEQRPWTCGKCYVFLHERSPEKSD